MAQGPLAIAMALSMRIMFEGEFIEISYDVALIVIAFNERALSPYASGASLWMPVRLEKISTFRGRGLMAGGGSHQVDYVRKGIIVLLLLGLWSLAINMSSTKAIMTLEGFALGFIILASYIIGELVELIKLPHITGYLLGGLFFGPSLGDPAQGLSRPPSYPPILIMVYSTPILFSNLAARHPCPPADLPNGRRRPQTQRNLEI